MQSSNAAPSLSLNSAYQFPVAKPLGITVLHGGPGAEREVSLQSGAAIHDALARIGHHVRVRDITPADMSALNEIKDVAFVALHGEFGEDGTLQTELDRRGIRYTGSGAAASKTAMDKVASKLRFIDVGVPTPEFEVASAQQWQRIAESFDLPAVVKPIDSGSSVDTHICRTRERFTDCIQLVLGRYGRALIESYIPGLELTVAILGSRALPVCEIRTKREFYDYQAKYVDEDTEYRFDLTVPQDVLDLIQQFSLMAHVALGCRDFSRVDWRLRLDDQRPYCLEVNTIPGFTSHSLLPKSAARMGMSFDELCERIVRMAVDER